MNKKIDAELKMFEKDAELYAANEALRFFEKRLGHVHSAVTDYRNEIVNKKLKEFVDA